MDLLIANLAERPDLGAMFAEFPDAWPEFMFHDTVSDLLFDRLLRDHPESQLIAVDPANPANPVARACAVPYRQAGALPARGYDHVILRGTADHGSPRGTVAAALEITVRPDMRGRGLSGRLLRALRTHLADLGYHELVAPVRPTGKHEHPHLPMARYIERLRPDGLPSDPWLRTHARCGATLAGVAATSMIVTAALDDWRAWTGLPFDTDGPVIVPSALVPVYCDLGQQVATYVEPNVWMRHRL